MKKVVAITAMLAFAAWLPARGAEVKENWEKNCAKCHGQDGKAATTMGKKLEVRDLTDAKVQSSFKDEEATKAIKEGIKADDKTKMPAYAEKLSDEEIKALVAFVRSLKKG